MKNLMTLGLTLLLTISAQLGWADEGKEKETVENFRNAGTGNVLDSAYGLSLIHI